MALYLCLSHSAMTCSTDLSTDSSPLHMLIISLLLSASFQLLHREETRTFSLQYSCCVRHRRTDAPFTGQCPTETPPATTELKSPCRASRRGAGWIQQTLDVHSGASCSLLSVLSQTTVFLSKADHKLLLHREINTRCFTDVVTLTH